MYIYTNKYMDKPTNLINSIHTWPRRRQEIKHIHPDEAVSTIYWRMACRNGTDKVANALLGHNPHCLATICHITFPFYISYTVYVHTLYNMCTILCVRWIKFVVRDMQKCFSTYVFFSKIKNISALNNHILHFHVRAFCFNFFFL